MLCTLSPIAHKTLIHRNRKLLLSSMLKTYIITTERKSSAYQRIANSAVYAVTCRGEHIDSFTTSKTWLDIWEKRQRIPAHRRHRMTLSSVAHKTSNHENIKNTIKVEVSAFAAMRRIPTYCQQRRVCCDLSHTRRSYLVNMRNIVEVVKTICCQLPQSTQCSSRALPGRG